MNMDDYKNSDNFQRTEGSKMISPHHFHPTNGMARILMMKEFGVCGWWLIEKYVNNPS